MSYIFFLLARTIKKYSKIRDSSCSPSTKFEVSLNLFIEIAFSLDHYYLEAPKMEKNDDLLP